MDKILKIIALIMGFIGACFAFADSWRTASRFSEDGVSLGYGPDLMTWGWRNIGRIGFILIALAFALEFISAILAIFYQKHKYNSSHNDPR